MDLAQLNIIRKSNGQEPLTELPEELGGKKKVEVPPVETAEQIEAKKKAEEEAAKKDEVKDPELTEEQILAFLKKKGISAEKLEDLKPKEKEPDAAEVEAQREAEELAFGLSSGLFKKSEYDSFVMDMKDPQTLFFDDYYQDAKKEDPDLSDEDILSEYNAKFGLDSEKDSRKWKRGIAEIKKLSAQLIREKHPKILTAKDAFSNHKKTTLEAAAAQKKVVDSLPAYRSDVDEVFNDLKKIPVKFSDTESYEVQVLDEHINELKAEMLNPEHAAKIITAGYDKKVLKEQVKASFLYKNWASLAKEISKQAVEKHAAGGHGVDLDGRRPPALDGGKELSESQKKLVELHKKHAPVSVN